MTTSAGRADGFDPAPTSRNDEAVVPGCETIGGLIPAYAQGALDDATAWQVEWHVAHCRECERNRSDVVPLPAVHVRDPQLVASIPLADVERYAMRESLRRELIKSAARRSRRSTYVVAAAALFAVAVWRGAGGRFMPAPSGRIAASPDSTRGLPMPAMRLPSGQASAPMATAVQLATVNASPEFTALREATRELEEALATAPDKGALYAFRDALEERRRELESRVVRVTE